MLLIEQFLLHLWFSIVLNVEFYTHTLFQPRLVYLRMRVEEGRTGGYGC